MTTSLGVEAFKYRNAAESDFILMNGLDHIRYQDLHDIYARSPFGLWHARQAVRYSFDYGYDSQLMLDDLGDDVHPVRHMSYTVDKIQRPLLYLQNLEGDEKFTPEQVVISLLAGTFHDIGECEHIEIKNAVGHTVGDVSYELKSPLDGNNENLVRQYLYGQLYPYLPRELLDNADDIIDNKEGTLEREAFNTVERLGYYITAVRAGQLAVAEVGILGSAKESILDAPNDRVVQLGRLALRVTNNHREFLQERAERFPYVDAQLKARTEADTQIQEQLAFLPDPAPQYA